MGGAGNAAVVANVRKLVHEFALYFPQSVNVSTASVWNDDIQGRNNQDRSWLFFPMHFANLPYDPEGVLDNVTRAASQDHTNVKFAIVEASNTIRNGKGIFMQALALRFLFHFDARPVRAPVALSGGSLIHTTCR